MSQEDTDMKIETSAKKEESKAPKVSIEMKYFPLFDGYLQTQLSVQMTGAQYRNLTEEQGELDPLVMKERKRMGRALFLCLDKSGSMCGSPYEALKEGSILIAKSVYENKEFEHFATIFHNEISVPMFADTFEEYEGKMRQSFAGGGNEFGTVFNYICEFIDSHEGIRDISVIFITDGYDCGIPRTEIAMANIKEKLTRMEIASRYLTLGFSAHHDAAYMNKIASLGSEMGNFCYVDTGKPYIDELRDCLQNSLNLARVEEGLPLKIETLVGKQTEKIVLAKNPIFVKKEGQGEQKGEDMEIEDPTLEILLPEEVQMYDFTKKFLLKETGIEDVQALMLLPIGEIPAILQKVKLEDPPLEFLIQAKVALINKLLFNYIQEVQKQERSMTNDELFIKLQNLESILNESGTLILRMKNRAVKDETLQEIQEAKAKTALLMQIIRQNAGPISNTQLAQLNDMAYRAIQTRRGLNKKLDERAIKNKEFYAKLDKQIEQASKKFKYEELKRLNKDIAEFIGQCPLSLYDTFEAMENGTCFGIGLEVERSEACIADPSLIKIKGIIPTFFSAEAFLDQAIYNLKADPNAHGGFKNSNPAQANPVEESKGLAQGLGRENVNAILPLYLFKEHWEIARRRAPPIFGHMVTCDIMGYAASQQFQVPFKVLLRAMYDFQQNSTEMNKRILDVILQTCKGIVAGNEEFRKNLIKQVTDFYTGPEFRTTDIIPSIQIFFAQLYCLVQLENIEEQIALTKKQLQIIFRFGFEEEYRRSLSRSVKEALTDDQTLDLLFPDHKTFFDAIILEKQTAINTELMSQLMSGVDKQMAPYTEMAQKFMDIEQGKVSASQVSQQDAAMEEVKQGDSIPIQAPSTSEEKEQDLTAFKSLNMEDIMLKTAQQGDAQPWLEQLQNKESTLYKSLMESVKTNFSKRFSLFFDLAKELNIVDDESRELKNPLYLPLINGDIEMLFAIHFQNMMHNKNANRRDAISSGTYKQILQNSEAKALLTEKLQLLMKNKAQSRTKILAEDAQKTLSNRGLNLFLIAPDYYHAAAILITIKLSISKSLELYEDIIEKGETVTAFKDKLRLLNQDYYLENRLFKDSFSPEREAERAEAFRKIHYKVWLELVRRRRILDTNEFKQIFPQAGYKIDLWNDTLDQNGLPKLNPKKFWTYVNEWKAKKREKKLKNKAELAAKKKF